MGEAEWTNGLILAVAVALAGADGSGVLVLVNASHADVDFQLPQGGSGQPWRLRLDSAEGRIDPLVDPQPADSAVVVPGRSMQIYSV